jgi:hypothetical protein
MSDNSKTDNRTAMDNIAGLMVQYTVGISKMVSEMAKVSTSIVIIKVLRGDTGKMDYLMAMASI